MIDIELMRLLAAANGITLNDEQLSMLDRYAELLVEWNKKINLTAITESNDIVVKHFLDSLLAAKYILSEGRLIDVGTGAGFPGMVLKIARPDIELHLMDSIAKKLGFLQAVCEEMSVTAEYVNMRAEDAARTEEFREAFDIVTARAVAPLRVLMEYCIPLLKVGGRLVAMKGAEAEMEVEDAAAALDKMNAVVTACDFFVLPDGSNRGIIVVEKTAATSDIYPRQPAAIRKRPL